VHFHLMACEVCAAFRGAGVSPALFLSRPNGKIYRFDFRSPKSAVATRFPVAPEKKYVPVKLAELCARVSSVSRKMYAITCG
jgi:hypothetical protein